jgi:uncharacterized membrane protein YqjE
MDTLYRVIFAVIIQVVIWFLWPRYRGKPYIPSFTEMLIFSLLMLIGGILLVFDLPYAQDIISVAAVFAFSGAVFRIVKRKRQAPFNTFIKELFVNDYGFKGFVYLLITGFVLFAVTAFVYESVKIPFFVYLFGISGITAVVIGWCGMIYGLIRFYTPMILNWFRNWLK